MTKSSRSLTVISSRPLSNQPSYLKLVKTIQDEIATAKERIQGIQGETCWKIGKYIFDFILEGKDRAEYGKHVYQQLAQDLKIAQRTLEQAVDFSRKFSIAHARAQLPWTHFRTLLTLPEPAARHRLIQKALREKLTSRELQKEVARHKAQNRLDLDEPIAPLSVPRGQLYTYKIIEPLSLKPVEGYKFVDCGFEIWQKVAVRQLAKFENGDRVETAKEDGVYKIRSTERSTQALYTFKAVIERVIDGDTLLVHVDYGFDGFTRQRLRLRGIDAPERATPEGAAAKRFLEARLKPNDFVIIKTHKSDKFDRYLVDVWYLPDESDPARVAAEGIHLNQELLNERLAVKW